VLISGKTGTLIGQLVNVSGCVSINELVLEEAEGTERVLFNCINPVGGGNSYYKLIFYSNAVVFFQFLLGKWKWMRFSYVQ